MAGLRDVRPRELMTVLERAGGVVRKGGKGDHINVKMPNGQIVTLPGRRGTIKIGLLKALLRKAGLSEAELIRLLEGKQ